MPQDLKVVALDLGSNSFHLILAELYNNRLHTVKRLREQIQLANGLGEDNHLSQAAQTRALECLTRFGKYTRDLSPEQVAIVGTYTLRVAHNINDFLTKAHEALGHPIDIISGEDEARLIYNGILYSCGISHQSRLIIDIGGGSTELIRGEHLHTQLLNSLEMGCVRLAQQFFNIKESRVTWSAEHFQNAYRYSCNIFAPLREEYHRLGWQECWGTSGTLDAVLHVLQAHQWTQGPSFNARGLEKLRLFLAEHPHMEINQLQGLTPQRANVFVSGLAILCAFFDVFEIAEIRYATGGLREGLLYQFVQTYGLDQSSLAVNFI